MAGYNPNRKKKSYSLNRSQPSRVVAAIVDGKVEYFDETLVVVDSTFYELNQPVSQGIPPVIVAEYDEDVIDFNWTDAETATFNITFTQNPYLTLEILPASGYENVAFFASNLSTTGFIANLSAPFSGQLAYRAIVSPVFPIIVERIVASASFYYTASAGAIAPSPSFEFTATYSQLAAATSPTHIFFTPIDDDNNGDADVVLVETGSMGLISTNVTFSAPVYNSIHYLAVKS